MISAPGPDRPIVRYLLGTLLAFGTANAIGGGCYGIAGAEGVPTDWLDGSPFKDYLVPSLILLTVVGGTLLFATIAVLARLHTAHLAAFSAGATVAGWLTVQVAIIGHVSWLQPATGIGALLIFVLTWLLPRGGHAASSRKGP